MSTPVTTAHSDENRGLFLCLVTVLLGFGVIMVQSASITSWPTDFEKIYLSRHLIFLSFGLVVALVCAGIPSRVWYQLAPWFWLATVALLVAVLVPGVGARVNGAQRWLRFGSVSLQPSELAKIAIPLYMCRLISANKQWLKHWWRGTLPLLLPIVVVIPLVLLQPDLGTSIFLLMGACVALFVGGWPLRNFGIGMLMCIPAAWYLFAMKPYQLKRITGFLETWHDWREAPYQLKQSLLALGTGGLNGVGLGKGWQKLSFLPEANTDFVFAVVGEEWGLWGTFSLCALWMGLYLSGLNLFKKHTRDSFATLTGFVLLTQLVLQAALNIAVVTAMVPPKGISLPLLSYGGSNLVVSLMMIGIVLSMSRQQNEITNRSKTLCTTK